jgi:sugar-specific transcriptional regulator TrmB
MNKDTSIYKILTDIGLPELEAKVYLAILQLGETTVLKISRATEIKRTTIYHVIESLKQKGLVSEDVQGLKSFLVAEDPQKLSQLLNARAKTFEGILPILSAQYQTKNKTVDTKIYIGAQAIRSVYDSLLEDIKPHQDYCVISNQHEWYDKDKEFFEDFMSRRAKLNINIRLLIIESETARKHKQFERNYNMHVRFLPKDTKLSTNLVIIPQKVVIHRLLEPTSATVLTDPAIIQMHKESFEIMWNSVKQ